MPAHDPLTITPGERALSRAIANAEGFGIPDAIPTRANNPGDLVIPHWPGQTLGTAQIAVFSSEQEGWMRLYHQLGLVSAGRSSVYTLGMTIGEMAERWTATQPKEWAVNVATWIAAHGYPKTTPATLLGALLSR